MRRTLTAAALLMISLAGLISPQESEAQSDASCRASAARILSAGGDPPVVVSEAVRANAPGAPCATQSATTLQETTIGALKAQAAVAFTSLEGNRVGAFAANATPELTLGTSVIRADTLVSSASNECVNGAPVLTGTSQVVGLTIDGQPINIPEGQQTIPLGGGSITFNEQVQADGVLAQRALVVRIPNVTEVVLAESIVGGDPCPRVTTPPATPTPAPTPQPPGNVCPNGSEFDPASGKCIIRDGNGPGNPGVNPIPVGPPFDGPSGGTVIGLPEARDRFKSPCLRGRGAKFVIIGNKRSNRVTGTDRRDRFLLFGGNDRAEGGRNHDCIDGGKGKDALSGALGKDRMYGKAGKDLLVGEAGNDVLNGGPGDDNPRAGYGRDRISGGKGVDAINVATNGPAAVFIRCGSGKDRVRINNNERDRVVGCERVFVIPDRPPPS